MIAPTARRGLAATLLALASALTAAQPAAALDEVPFITTPDHVTEAMLVLADVTPGDHVIDLGSGDGRIVITAARRFGASGLGVELDPALVERSLSNARRAGVAQRVEFRVQDLFLTDLARASVITMYLLPDVNLALRPRLLALAPGTRIVSHDWDLGDWAPDRTLTLAVPDKAVGREKLSRLHLWTVPARLHGLWCGAAGLRLQLDQRYQAAAATLEAGSDRRSFSGRIEGRRLQLLGAGAASLAADADADGLRIGQVSGDLPLQAGQQLRPAANGSCAGP